MVPAGRALSLLVVAASGLVLPGLSVPALAQEPAVPPVFATRGDLVVIDVVATDENGMPVAGLGAEDFTVREEGVVQPIVRFEGVAAPEALAPASAETALPETTDRMVRTPPTRATIVVVFDDLHLTPDECRRARDTLAATLERADLGPAEVLAIGTGGGGGWRTWLPEQRASLRVVLARFQGRQVARRRGEMSDVEAYFIDARRDRVVETQVFRRYVDSGLLANMKIDMSGEGERPGRGFIAPSWMRGEDHDEPDIGRVAIRAEAAARNRDARTRRDATLQGLARLLLGFADRPGRKTVLLVSRGFAHEPETMATYRLLADAARQAHATVDLIDARDGGDSFTSLDVERRSLRDPRDEGDTHGRALQEAQGAETAALSTGGRVVRGLGALGPALRQLGAGLRTYYMLGYVPSPPETGGPAFRRLEVTVARPGVNVRSRSGYYPHGMPSDGAEGAVAARLGRPGALGSVADGAGLPVHLSAWARLTAESEKAQVRLVGEVESAAVAAGETPVEVDLAFELVARDRPEVLRRDGHLKIDPAAAAASGADGSSVRVQVELEAPPGAYQARFGVHGTGGADGNVRLDVTVPARADLFASTPVLTDAFTGTATRVEPLLRASRRFRRNRPLYCLVSVPDAETTALVAGYTLVGPDGTVRLKSDLQEVRAGRGALVWTIPLASLLPGPYELRLRVEDSRTDRTEERIEPFEVIEAPTGG